METVKLSKTQPNKCLNYLRLNKNKLNEIDVAVDTEDQLVLLLDKLLDADPDPNGKHCIWIIDQFKNKQFLLEDVSRVKRDISEYFEKTKKKLPESYTIVKKELSTPISEMEMEKLFKTKKEKDIQVLYNGPLGLLLIPNTVEASCKYGANTRWCTAATESENMFEDYSANGPLYIWIDKKKKNEKFQFHFEDRQFKDDNDDDLDDETLEMFRTEHPVLKKLFAEKEKELSTRPIWAYRYAKDILHGPFPEAEDSILKNPSYAIEYVTKVIKKRWPKGEAEFVKDPMNAFYYAKLVLKDRWPEAERTIMRDREAVDEYNRFLKNIGKGEFMLKPRSRSPSPNRK